MTHCQRSVLILVCLTLLPLFRAGAQEAREVVGVPWTGASGITETVEQIMARERTRKPFEWSELRETRPEPRVPRHEKRENPNAPTVSQWPALSNLSPNGDPNLNPQTVGTTFLANQSSESGFVPPDVVGAVGPDQVLVPSNGRIKVFDKTGVLGGLNVTTDVFFASVRTASTSDPHVRYDRLSQRWFIVMIDVATPNRVLIAVSSGSHITSTSSFTFYQFQHDLVGTTPNTDTGGFADYPTLGVDANALYVGMNIFNAAGTALIGTTVYIVRKSALLTGSLVVTPFRQIGAAGGTGAGPWTPQGVDNDDPGATEGYFIGVDAASFSLLNVRRVSTPGGTPTLSANLNVTVPTTYFPLNVPALGTSTLLDALDDRLFAAALHKNKITGSSSIWTAHNIRVNTSGVGGSTGTRDACRWYEIGTLTGSPSLLQSGTLFDPTAANPRYFWIPSVAMSGQGHVALGSSTAGTGLRAEIAASGRLSSDAPGTTQAFTLAQASTFAYNVTVTNPQRWGDYSQTVVDPTDDMTLWTFQEYCNATNSWGVRVIQLKAPPPATPSLAIPGTVRQGESGVNVVISGTSVSGSGFFDPGTDVGGPGFTNHISATISGTGVTVNSVTFNTPTQVTLNVSVSLSAALGGRTVTVTNPDAQGVTSASAILNVDVPLPIQLASFSGRFINATDVRLDWLTLSEINNYGFEVQKRADQAGEFRTIEGSFIPGHGTTNEPHSYSYTDLLVQTRLPNYRLKQMDLDGSTNYSDPISVQLPTGVENEALPTEFSLGQNYPNPFNPSTVIQYGLPVASEVKLEVFNTLGQTVAVLVSGRQEAGFHTATFENQTFSSGVYFYTIEAGQFRASKKLLLLR